MAPKPEVLKKASGFFQAFGLAKTVEAQQIKDPATTKPTPFQKLAESYAPRNIQQKMQESTGVK